MVDHSVTSFSLPIELKHRLREVLAREGKSVSRWVQDYAEEYVKAHGAGNPAVPLDKFLDNPKYVACPTLLEADKFNVRSIAHQDLPEWRARTHRFLKRLLDEEGRRKAGGNPE